MDGREGEAVAEIHFAAAPVVGTVDAAEGRAGTNRGLRDPTISKQRPKRKVIRWERFLPRRSLRVLLVEHDDSTRHIVTALLRKCSYQVAAVADGLKAWEVLKEKQYNFDIVLTEVEMPSLSGIGLLSKIMGSELSKSIPVIMMSSHDSIGVVFKCMQKGAMDFLLKPVRKNELRNLWQHVWRKHCSTSYTNGPDTLSNNQPRSDDTSDNNAGSNYLSVNAGSDSKSKDICEKESDTQSSGSKPLMEIGSPKNIGEPIIDEQSALRLMEETLEKPNNGTTHVTNTTRLHACGETKNKSMRVEVDAAPTLETALTEKSRDQDFFCYRSLCRETDLYFSRCKGSEKVDDVPSCRDAAPCEPPKEVIDFVGLSIRQCSYAISENGGQDEDALLKYAKSSHVNNAHGSSPSWDLCLKRPQLNGCSKQEFQEKHMLNHSAASAFSRYGQREVHLSSQKFGFSPSTSCIRTRNKYEKCQSHLSSHDGDNEKELPFAPRGLILSQDNEVKATNCHHMSSSSKNEGDDPYAADPSREGIGSGHAFKDNMVYPHAQLGLMPLPIPVGAIPFQSICSGYGALWQPIFYPKPSLPLLGSPAVEKAKDFSTHQLGQQSSHLINDLQSIKFHHCEESYVRHLEQGKKDDPARIEEPGVSRPLICSNMELTDQIGSCSRDILIASKRNGIGQSTDAHINLCIAVENGNESGSQNCYRKGLDHVRSRREVALIKFHMKRKDRCFEKKVRYHSRQKLAEQRPRIKGQFVRQGAVESFMMASEADD